MDKIRTCDIKKYFDFLGGEIVFFPSNGKGSCRLTWANSPIVAKTLLITPGFGSGSGSFSFKIKAYGNKVWETECRLVYEKPFFYKSKLHTETISVMGKLLLGLWSQDFSGKWIFKLFSILRTSLTHESWEVPWFKNFFHASSKLYLCDHLP